MTDLDESLRQAKPMIRGNPIRWLVLGGLLLIAAFAIGTAIMVSNFRERALENRARELENTVLLLARHLDQQLEDFEVIQKDLIAYVRGAGIASSEAYRERMSSRDIHLLLKAKIGATSYVGGINLFDSEGTLINSSTAWPVPHVNIADRPYFKTFKSSPRSPVMLVEPVHSRITGVWTTVIARKMIGTDGEFLGAIGRGIEPAHFEKFFASLALGDDSVVAMFHRDGTLLARHPQIASALGQNFKSGAIFQKILSTANHGTVRSNSQMDHKDRLVAARQLTAFPIVITASITEAAALSDWREETRYLTGAVASTVILMATLLFLVVRKLSLQHRASQQLLTLEKGRLNTAVNNMAQGLLLFDSSQRLIVCNQRYIEMYGLSTDVVKPGCTLRELMAHRKATGSFEGDAEAFSTRILRDLGRRKKDIIEIDTADGRRIQITSQPVPNEGWVATHEDITDRTRAQERIRHLAHYDALTDLPNRVLFRDYLEGRLHRIEPGEKLAVLYIDIDEFKSINDTLGHLIGDELLKSVAGSLRDCVGENDFVARLGGDEFAVVQNLVGCKTNIRELLAKIYLAIRAPYDCLGHQLTTDASIGIAIAPQDGSNLNQILKNADLAMYSAKSDGRRTYRFFEPEMVARVNARRVLEVDLRQAISDHALELYYQPCVNLHDNSISGCEALLRWRHAERGMISPAEFIPVAEETGLINELGEWVLMTACAEAATWPEHIKLAVNVSPVQFKSDTLALKVVGALAASGLVANRLEIEVTEAVLIRDDEAALAILHQLRALGVRIALDDFGTGYSSLSYLQRFPFDKIKIDRCFVNDIEQSGGSFSIVQAVVNIAAAQNMTTTAEGVETQKQFELLRALGCTEMQGYLFSAAKPAAELKKLFGLHGDARAAVA